MRTLGIIVILLQWSFCFSQDEESRRFNLGVSFSPGFLSERTFSNQVHGYAGWLKNNIELRVDGFYFLGSYGDRPRFALNHQLFAGATYRFKINDFSPYLGFQPGVAYSQSSEYRTLNLKTGEFEFKKAVNPIGAIIIGFSQSIRSLLFVFVEGRYIFGKHKANTYPTFLDETRLSIGLGLSF